MLNMSSAERETAPVADLTAQARIRNAAIIRFGDLGFTGANVRDIAAEAGVSPALVLHHFGSKAGLRAACDEYVLRSLVQLARDDASAAGVVAALGSFLGGSSELDGLVRYMVRSIEEDSPTADQFVEALVTESEKIFADGIADGSMRPTSDLRALAVLTVLNSLALLTMPRPIARALGYDSLNSQIMTRMTRPALELYTYGLYTDDTMLKSIQAALDEAQASGVLPTPEKSKKENND